MHSLFREEHGTDIVIFGLDTGRIANSFSIGDLKILPKFNLEEYLEGYDEDDVGFILDYGKYAQYQPRSTSTIPFFSPMVDDICLLPFRLFKMGWLSAMRISPVTKIGGIESRCDIDLTRHLSGQIWADYSNYKINKREIPLIEEKYRQISLLPKGYLEMALRRFSMSYKYIQHSQYAGSSELDDYWVDLVIALEGMTTRRGEPVTSNMAKRTGILLGKDESERTKIEQIVRKIYKHRCDIVHGNEKDKITEGTHSNRFEEAEELRTLIRDTINACMYLLNDPTLTIYKPLGERKTITEIIDENYYRMSESN